MLRNVALLVALGAAVLGCGDSGTTEPQPPPPPPPPSLNVKSISPDHAFPVGGDIAVTITGSAFEGPPGLGKRSSWAVWRGHETTQLATTFVSPTELIAVVPANLLRDAGSASLVVESGDPIAVSDGVPPTVSNPVVFVVFPRDVSFLVAPVSAKAGSPDLTITVQGLGFHDRVHHQWSNVVLSVNGTDTWLATTFVSSSELTAVIPAALLTKPVVAVVSVWTGDPMGDVDGIRAGAATFTVTR